MAKAVITRYSTEARRWSRLSQGQAISVLSGHEGARITLALDAGDVEHSPPAESPGIYRIKIIGADVTLRIGKDAVADATGELWEDGETELRYVAAGERISIKQDA